MSENPVLVVLCANPDQGIQWRDMVILATVGSDPTYARFEGSHKYIRLYV